jgi:hypothetical protein
MFSGSQVCKVETPCLLVAGGYSSGAMFTGSQVCTVEMPFLLVAGGLQ